MLSSREILQTLDYYTSQVIETLNNEQTHQCIELLSRVEAQTENPKEREDAVDELYGFCLNFPKIAELLDDKADIYRGGERGKPDATPTEKEKQMRLYANRLIKKVRKEATQPKEKPHERG